jgi:hypothetical protein
VDHRPDPFAALGLAAASGLTDDDVRAAWRRVAAATHPDRADGGDPERFAAAAAAYTALRTPFGRGVAQADLRAAPRRRGPPRVALPRVALPGVALPRVLRAARAGMRTRLARGRRELARRGPPSRAGLALSLLASRARRGRLFRLALRAALAAAVGTVAALTAGSAPATPALITGALTWFALTARHDLAPTATVPPPGPAPAATGARAGHRTDGGSR